MMCTKRSQPRAQTPNITLRMIAFSTCCSCRVRVMLCSQRCVFSDALPMAEDVILVKGKLAAFLGYSLGDKKVNFSWLEMILLPLSPYEIHRPILLSQWILCFLCWFQIGCYKYCKSRWTYPEVKIEIDNRKCELFMKMAATMANQETASARHARWNRPLMLRELKK